MKKKTTTIARSVFGNVAEVEILPDDLLAHLRALAEPAMINEAEALREMRAAIEAELQGHGWPPLDARITVGPDGEWHLTEDMSADVARLASAWAGTSARIPLGRNYIEEKVEPLSTDWFLIRMADRIMRVLDGLRRDDARAVLGDAVALGADMRELELIQRGARKWAEAGKKSGDGADDANERRKRESFAAVHAAEAQELADRIAREHPNWPWTQVRLSLRNELRQIGIHIGDEVLRKTLKNPTSRKKAG